jgi:hypothetical protein
MRKILGSIGAMLAIGLLMATSAAPASAGGSGKAGCGLKEGCASSGFGVYAVADAPEFGFDVSVQAAPVQGHGTADTYSG